MTCECGGRIEAALFTETGAVSNTSPLRAGIRGRSRALAVSAILDPTVRKGDNVRARVWLPVVASLLALSCGETASDDGARHCGVGTEEFVAPMISERIEDPSCLPRALGVRDDGSLMCSNYLLEVLAAGDCSCDAPGRAPSHPDVVGSIVASERALGNCDIEGRPECADLRICEILRVADEDLASCLNEQNPTGAGFCYLDAEVDLNGDGDAECADGVSSDCIGNPAVLEALGCSTVGSRRALRLLGVDPRAAVYYAAAGVICGA